MNNKQNKIIYLKGVTIWVLYTYDCFFKKTYLNYYHGEIRYKNHLKLIQSRTEKYSILYNLLHTKEIKSIQTPYLGYLKPAV